MRLLIIEDNKRVALALRETLRTSYVVDVEYSAKGALNNINLSHYDVILLDLGLPDMDGQALCRQLRDRNITAPIIIVTGDDATVTKVGVLDSGADDYVTKPFSKEELKARIRAVMRRHGHRKAASLRLGDLELDPASRIVVRASKEINLRRKEFDLLEYMMRNHGRTLTRPMIIDHVWESGDGLWTNAVDVHIKYLRDKIDRPFGSQLIKTVHGVGYKLDAEAAEGDVANT
jgi:two-component system, OmpR family, response regulator